MDGVKGRTQKDVLDYIRLNTINGSITQSLMDMGKELGYSNATIHRVLTSLEEKGLISIIRSDIPNKPNTIVYERPDEVELSKVDHVIMEVRTVMASLDRVLQELTEIRKYSTKVRDRDVETTTTFEEDVASRP